MEGDGGGRGGGGGRVSVGGAGARSSARAPTLAPVFSTAFCSLSRPPTEENSSESGLSIFSSTTLSLSILTTILSEGAAGRGEAQDDARTELKLSVGIRALFRPARRAPRCGTAYQTAGGAWGLTRRKETDRRFCIRAAAGHPGRPRARAQSGRDILCYKCSGAASGPSFPAPSATPALPSSRRRPRALSEGETVEQLPASDTCWPLTSTSSSTSAGVRSSFWRQRHERCVALSASSSPWPQLPWR